MPREPASASPPEGYAVIVVTGSVLSDRVTALVCRLSRRHRGFLGLVRGGGLPDLLDQHLQRPGRRDGQQRRDETAEYAADQAAERGADQHGDEYE